MSRAFVAFYMGDYQKKTQHLDTLQHGAYSLLLQHCWTHGSIPLEPAARAAIARMTLPAWKKIAPIINAFFDVDGRNKRATEEIEKSERIRLKRSIAGRSGGHQAGISKAIAKGQQIRSNELANARQNSQQKPGYCEPNKNSKLESFLTTARELVDETKQTGGSLATALPTGALREPPSDGSLAEALERTGAAARAGCPPGRPCWIDWNTPEWNAHEGWRRSRAWKPPAPIKRMQDGVELTGQWFETRVPAGYDEATGERIAPSNAEENAA
jgi:uncharacterized protein YdaU (DUF1376 family)